MSAPLEAAGVTRHFAVRGRIVRAVEDVDLALDSGRTIGLVGESGCGKTTLTRLLLQLDRPTSGSVRFDGRDVATLDGAARKAYRRAVQPVLQNPYSSLDPRMRVGRIVSEPLRAASSLASRAIADKVAQALESVGLRAADAEKYPHEFSGGQRQRIAIARALACDPQVIVLDEAVSSQDVSIRAQILNLLVDLQRARGIAYLFVAHDLATVRYLSERVHVMYLGRVVEVAASDQLYDEPLHPYTRALLAACLPADPDAPRPAVVLEGEVPSPLEPPRGCKFHTRCPLARPQCAEQEPPLKEVAPGRFVRCVLY